MSDNKDLAYQDYLNGMKYKEITKKHGVTIHTVKSWKTPHKGTLMMCIPKKKSVRTKKERWSISE